MHLLIWKCWIQNVGWSKTFEILKSLGIKCNEKKMTLNLYKTQTAMIVYRTAKEEGKKQREVRDAIYPFSVHM